MRSLFADDKLVVPAPADRRLGLRRRAALHLRRRAGRTDRLRAAALQRSRTTASEILPLLRRALALNPQLKVIATPWSPPAWMKTNDSLIGGRLMDDPAHLRRVRALLRQVRPGLRARRRAGLRADLQNEPQNRKPNAYPGMDMPVRQEAKLIEALGPALRARGPAHQDPRLRPQLGEHPGDVATTPPGEDPETEYPTDLLDSRAGRWLAGTAYHCYSGDPSARPSSTQRFPQRASGSPSAPARTARPTRRRRSSPTR